MYWINYEVTVHKHKVGDFRSNKAYGCSRWRMKGPADYLYIESDTAPMAICLAFLAT